MPWENGRPLVSVGVWKGGEEGRDVGRRPLAFVFECRHGSAGPTYGERSQRVGESVDLLMIWRSKAGNEVNAWAQVHELGDMI